MKKLLCLLLVLAVFSTFVACKSGEGDGKTTTGTTTTVTEVNPFEEFMTITWLTQLNADWQDGRWDELELEEMFNVDLQVWAEDGRDTARMAALVAAGDIPDYFFMPGAPRDPFGMFEEQLTRSITIQQIKDWIPGFYELLVKLPVGFDYNLVPGKTDEYIGITHCNISGSQYYYDATCINLDWLEAIGYGFDESALVPVKMVVEGYDRFNDNLFFTEGNFTFEEMNDIMKKFTEDDPDGNGVDDTFGMLYMIESAWTNMTQEGLFGFVHDLNYRYKDPVTGDIVPKYAYTPYRDYFAWVSDNLNKGYMKNLPGQGGWVAEYQEVSGTGKYGIFSINGGGYLSLNSDTYRVYPPQNIWLRGDEDARFVAGPMFRGPEGKLVDMSYNIDPYGVGTYRVQMFGAQVDDAKLERICRLLQYTTFASEDIYLRYKYGIEGIHWKWAADPYISTRIATPTAELPEQYRGQLNVFGLWVYPSTVQQQIDNAVKNGYWAYMPYMHANGLFEKYALNPEKFVSAVYMGQELFTEYSKVKADLNAEMNPIINDFKARALAGQIANFNTEWTQYIDQLYAAGLEKLINDYYNNPEFKQYDPGEKFTMKSS